MALVAVVVVVAAGFAVYRLRGIFASEDVVSTPSGAENDIVPFNPKRVLLEVFGPPGVVATVTYTDVEAQPQKAEGRTAVGVRHHHHGSGRLRQHRGARRRRLDQVSDHHRQ